MYSPKTFFHPPQLNTIKLAPVCRFESNKIIITYQTESDANASLRLLEHIVKYSGLDGSQVIKIPAQSMQALGKELIFTTNDKEVFDNFCNLLESHGLINLDQKNTFINSFNSLPTAQQYL